MSLVRRRGRVLASLTAAALVAGAATTAVLGSTAQAAPTPDCKAPHPVASPTPGEPVTGKTVSPGVTPTPFTGEVIGVLDDGIAPGSTGDRRPELAGRSRPHRRHLAGHVGVPGVRGRR